MISIVVADDHHLVRQGVRALLERHEGFQVVGEAADGWKALSLVQHLQPDILVLDLAMPDLNGIQVAQQVRDMDGPTSVVVLSMYAGEALVKEVLRAGVLGYVLKRSVTDDLVAAVLTAYHQGFYLSPAVSPRSVEDLLAEETVPGGFNTLTPRERQVLQLVAEGHTNMAIAWALDVSARTVEKHRASVMAKLKVSDVAGLIRAAMEYGLVFWDECG